MKKVVAYAAGVPSPHKNEQKVLILKNFIEGVSAKGDNGILYKGKVVDTTADLAVIQGWVHSGSPSTPHLVLRKNVFEKSKNTIIVDSNLFNYNLGKDHHLQYLRYSMNGVFPTTGNYFDRVPDMNRWKQISNDLQLKIKPWRSSGEHILIPTQRNGGWSMQGLSVTDWLDKTIGEIRQYSDRPIVVRGHPGDKEKHRYLKRDARYTLSRNPNIQDDLINAWATVTYNSSPGVASAIEGIPVFVTDPNPAASQAHDVANTNLATLENPATFERDYWLAKLSMSHWKFSELKDGTAWQHMRKFL